MNGKSPAGAFRRKKGARREEKGEIHMEGILKLIKNIEGG
jgi:hypothetical protein